MSTAYQRAKSVLQDYVQDANKLRELEKSLLKTLLTSMAQGFARAIKVAADMLMGKPSWYPKLWKSVTRSIDKIKQSGASKFSQMVPAAALIVRKAASEYLQVVQRRVVVGTIIMVPIPREICQIRTLARLPILTSNGAMELSEQATCLSTTTAYRVPDFHKCQDYGSVWYCHLQQQQPDKGCLATIKQKCEIPKLCDLRMAKQNLN